MRLTSLLRRLSVSLIVVTLIPRSALALDAVLVIPLVPGGSYSGAIGGPGSSQGSQVIAFENAASRALDFQLGSGTTLGGFGATFRLVKLSDDATIPLNQRLATGTFIPDLEVRMIVGGQTVIYQFATTFITGIKTTGSLDSPYDEVTFVPCAMRITSTSGAVQPFEWNFQSNLAQFPGTCI